MVKTPDKRAGEEDELDEDWTIVGDDTDIDSVPFDVQDLEPLTGLRQAPTDSSATGSATQMLASMALEGSRMSRDGGNKGN